MHPEHRSIGELAYHLWQARGCPEGSAEQDWLDAEKQLKSAPRTAEPRAAEPRAATPTASAGHRADELPASADAKRKAAAAPRTGSAARPRRSKSTQGKPSPEPPG
jgi:LmbE family N-acetylglucosaminyl deacetylase